MSIDTYIQNEGWVLTFSLYDADDNLVSADGEVKVTWRPFNHGSDFPAFAYVFGSDGEFTQTASGVYVLNDATIAPNVYDVEFRADGTNKERKRTTIRILDESPS